MDVLRLKRSTRRQKDCEPELFLLIEEAAIENGSPPERLLPRDIIAPTEHGSERSGQRGCAAHATNEGVLDKDIERLARWRSIENAAG